jgi:hypothetical protein
MRRASAGCAVAVAGLASIAGAFGAGCGVTDEIVARVGPPESGPPPVVAGQSCRTNDDCGDGDGGGRDGGSGYFCSKASCAAETGTCELPQTVCEGANPQCGCTTGLLYWDDCLRQQAGESAVATGMMGGADCKPKLCASTAPGECPSGAYCALFEVGCEAPTDPREPNGLCLVLPDSCQTNAVLLPGELPNPMFTSCATGACLDYCSAVKAGPVLPSPSCGDFPLDAGH